MAVSFKVPASPKRSIFVIDEFMGVDLTNSGSNIEDTRSPNAENMIRNVPGKVRKRMGYEKEVLFGKNTNVNYALGTSAQEKEYIISDDDAGQYVDLYLLREDIKDPDGGAFDAYFEFDYKSSESFWIEDIVEVPASEEWEHFSYVHSQNHGRLFRAIQIMSSLPNEIYIKNFSVMMGKDASYQWSPSPTYFVKRATNDPVYGVHIGKTGTFEGNRVVNVNRVLGTSDTLVTKTVTTTSQKIYDFAEAIYPGTKIYIEFDYELTGDSVIVDSVSGWLAKVNATSGIEHYSGSYTWAGYHNNTDIKLLSTGNSTFSYRNFSIMYDIDVATYDWSAAPEDNGGEFAVEDLYLVGSKNYAVSESFDTANNASGGILNERYTIEDASSNVGGFVHISFDLHTASYNSLTKIEVGLVNSETPASWFKIDESNEHYKSKHFDIYISSGFSATDYITQIGVDYTVGGNGACWTYISNIQVNEITPRSSYDISPKWYIYHVGADFYLRASNSKDFTKVYNNANQHLSKSWQFNKMLYILDGKDIYSYTIGDETVTPIGEDNGYIPTLTIAKEPSGGGISYESLNMLQPGFYEYFQGKASITNFHLSFGNLDSTPVKAWVLNMAGGWDEKTEGSHFTVNRGTGEVQFFSAPGVSPITGEDNVKILAYRTFPGYRERITNCTNGTLFGVGGAEDRLFLTGNPDYPNWDFYSEQYNPTYFPDTGYSALGSEQSAIVGYAIVNNYLAAFKDGFDTSQSVFIREGDLIVDENDVSQPAFKLINTLQGHGVIAPYAFGYLTQEPLFLTKSGIYAITAQDITGEKYSQNRSFYLNGKLTEEDNLENAVATVFNDMYVLAVNDQLYILDGLQATRTDRSEPYSTRQYVGFHCNGVPAVCIWEDEALFFGTSDGKVCKFFTDRDSLESYADDGYPIYCCWETPDLDGKLFYKNKTFRYFAVRMMTALKTSIKIWSKKLGAWTFIKEDRNVGVLFNFETIDFERFSFSTDTTEKVAHTKVRVKKVDKARFKVENDALYEPFGLFDLALEYVESGNYKG